MKNLIVVSVPMMMMIMSCGADDSSVAKSESTNSYIRALNAPQPDGESDVESLGQVPDEEKPADPAGYFCEVEKFSARAIYDQSINLNPTSDVIYLGALLDGGSLETGSYVPITAQRGPMTFSLSHQSLRETGHVYDVKLSTVRDEFKRIINDSNVGSSTSEVSFQMEEVYNKKQLGLAIGVGFGGLGGSILGALGAFFKFDINKTFSRHLVKFTQVYFSADIDIPNNPSDFFQPDVCWNDVANDITNDMSPVYVSSVKYGRLVLFSVVSTEKSADVTAALGFFFAGCPAGVAAGLKAKYEKIVSESTIQAQIFGGDSGESVKAINGIEELKSFISSGGNFSLNSPGYPLTYTLRYLSNNEVVKVENKTDYLIRNCVLKPYKFRLSLDRLMATKVTEADKTAELYGWVDTSAAYYDDNGNQIGGDFVEERLWSNDGGFNSVKLSQGDSHVIDNVREFTFNPELAENACITIRAQLKDHDYLPWDGDDDLGVDEMKICVSDDRTQWQDGDGHFDLDNFSDSDTGALFRFYFDPVDP